MRIFRQRKNKEKQLKTKDNGFQVKYEGFSIPTEIKDYDTEEDAEEGIRIRVHEYTKNYSELFDFYENNRVVESFDPEGNEWMCCTRLWI